MPVEQLSPVIEVEKPEIAEAVADSQAIVPFERSTQKPKFDDVVDAEVVVPDAEPVKVTPPAKIVDAEKPAVIDAVSPDEVEEHVDHSKTRSAHIVVDDPGVDNSKPSQKAQSGLRLF